MPTYIRLTDYKSSDEKEQGFFNPENRYEANQKDFEKIPGNRIAFWISSTTKDSFKDSVELEKMSPVRQGIASGDNERFLRFWYEISHAFFTSKCNTTEEAHNSNFKWFPFNKGGKQRKWYGNLEHVIIFDVEHYAILATMGNNLPSKQFYFKQGISWTAISSGDFATRIQPVGVIFSNAGMATFPKENQLNYLLAFLNTKTLQSLIKIFSQTVNFNAGDVKPLPIIFPKNDSIKKQINQLTQQNIDISKEEWDSRETSWDFTKNELLKHKQDGSLENVLNAYEIYWTSQFNQLHANEEELNRLFIDIYGLQDELTPDVAPEDITILKNEAKIVNGQLEFQNSEIIKQFISYAVGCMFGRYTLDEDGLVVGNLGQEIPKDTTYGIDDDNIIPIVDESDYFSDDMTDRFTEFVRTTFGSEKLQQNIAFIEKVIGKKLRNYFVKDFYKDHIKRYKKRPIYWLFSSPKGTFQTLIYMHRYTPDTLNNILNDYLRPFRNRLETMRNEAMRTTEREDVTPREKTEADKKIDKIDKTLDDINAYEKILAHYAAQRIEIDLDDGVKVNYCKFKELLVEFDKKLCK
jgi:hypothetical protein